MYIYTWKPKPPSFFNGWNMVKHPGFLKTSKDLESYNLKQPFFTWMFRGTTRFTFLSKEASGIWKSFHLIRETVFVSGYALYILYLDPLHIESQFFWGSSLQLFPFVMVFLFLFQMRNLSNKTHKKFGFPNSAKNDQCKVPQTHQAACETVWSLSELNKRMNKYFIGGSIGGWKTRFFILPVSRVFRVSKWNTRNTVCVFFLW